jgi:hypothetical protein
MSLPFFTGQIPTAADFNALAVKVDLASSSGASLIGYGGSTVAAALAAVTTPLVLSVAGRVGNVTLAVGDVSGAAALAGSSSQTFNVATATGPNHAVSLSQASGLFAPLGSSGTGTVTSVGLSLPSTFTVSGSPVTSVGSLSASWASQAAKSFLASPTGAAGGPVFRPIASADLPTVGIAQGGTGQITAQNGLNALTSVAGATNEYVLTKDTGTGNALWKVAAGGSSGINVLNFAGADPTGATSSLAAFNSAAAAATASGQVIVPPGTWNLSAATSTCTWVVDGNATFTGAGKITGKIIRFAGGLGAVKGAQFGSISNFAESVRTYSQSISMMSVLSPTGNVAVLGASQTSDSLSAGAQGCIGLESIVENNNIAQSQYAFGAYIEATRRSTGTGSTHGTEIDIINYGSVIQVDPSQAPYGLTNALWLAAGGGYPASSSNSLALGILNNSATFEKGIVFFDGAITNYGGLSTAIAMGYQQGIAWYAGPTKVAHIKSDTTVASMGISFQNNSIGLQDSAGTTKLLFDANCQITANGGSSALSISATYLNLVGVTTSATAAAGSGPALPSVPYGYITIQLNGGNVKIPFYG